MGCSHIAHLRVHELLNVFNIPNEFLPQTGQYTLLHAHARPHGFKDFALTELITTMMTVNAKFINLNYLKHSILQT